MGKKSKTVVLVDKDVLSSLSSYDFCCLPGKVGKVGKKITLRHEITGASSFSVIEKRVKVVAFQERDWQSRDGFTVCKFVKTLDGKFIELS